MLPAHFSCLTYDRVIKTPLSVALDTGPSTKSGTKFDSGAKFKIGALNGPCIRLIVFFINFQIFLTFLEVLFVAAF